ncbi:acetolactate decarboxylase [Carnimonas nigrificans]|uniref:acetolactate decarboxylase n=1 Tax=Carnimonas nigrificans TaxID=64323 RepID=UPI0004702B68|nr:acetolactate decarboxylase [Carnimonas nigrificans]
MTNAPCDCAERIAAAYLAQHDHPAASDSVEIYQTSLMSGLIAGVYEGETTLGDLFTHGDFGLGTFDNLDGELIAFDKEAHQLRSDGSASATTNDQKTPFAVVTEFNPSVEITLDEAMDSDAIEALIDRLVPSENHFCAIRIDGDFEWVSTRTVPRQERPYKPMLEAIAEQPTFDFKESSGTMIGFRTPSYLQGVNVAGYHIHYITDQRDGGGHVLNYRVTRGTLQLSVISKLRIDLPRTSDFLDADLNPADIDEAIRQAEA